LAEKAKPKLLVLSHILFWGSSPEDIASEIKTRFTGDFVVAEDLMVID
jgi:ribonuclease BN (tRNA processing enzyme)